MKKRREIQQYRYKCTLTGEEFITTKEAKNPDELVSVRGFYELNAQEDDRPEIIKKQETLNTETKPS